jgi:hypothetical protein
MAGLFDAEPESYAHPWPPAITEEEHKGKNFAPKSIVDRMIGTHHLNERAP